MEQLYRLLEAYHEQDIYPFHMPGHKRNPACTDLPLPLQMDITEITGFDDLHHAEGAIREMLDAAAALYGARESFLSVNGSTAGILAAVFAAAAPGERVLCARNCHRSVYHAIALRGLTSAYVLPAECRPGLNGSVRAEDVRSALAAHPGTRAVIVTSPTYDGIVSDIRAIADAAHAAGAVLIVDEAHGAHLRFSDYFPTSAVEAGADLVIQSIHKTLPALTQTALLHRCTDRIDGHRLQAFLSMVGTSSPSYILMASADACIAALVRDGEEMFRTYTERLKAFRGDVSDLRSLPLIMPQTCAGGTAQTADACAVFAYDRSKILISTREAGMTGPALHKLLHDRFRLECEMAGPDYVLALSSVGDTEEGFARLAAALKTLDKEIADANPVRGETAAVLSLQLPEPILPIGQAMEEAGAERELAEAVGCVSGEFACVYPPGIPLIAPGERITEEFIRQWEACRAAGLNLTGLADPENRKIRVIG